MWGDTRCGVWAHPGMHGYGGCVCGVCVRRACVGMYAHVQGMRVCEGCTCILMGSFVWYRCEGEYWCVSSMSGGVWGGCTGLWDICPGMCLTPGGTV